MISELGNQYAMWAVGSSDSHTQGIRCECQQILGMVMLVPGVDMLFIDELRSVNATAWDYPGS
jgi:hypothetical protein